MKNRPERTMRLNHTLMLVLLIVTISLAMIQGCGADVLSPGRGPYPEITELPPIAADTVLANYEAIVVGAEFVPIFAGPDPSYAQIAVLVRDDSVQVLQHYQCSYFQVLTPDGLEGWIQNQVLDYGFTCDDLTEILELPPTLVPEEFEESPEPDFPTPYSTEAPAIEAYTPDELQSLLGLNLSKD